MLRAARYLVRIILSIIQLLLIFRFLLMFFVANPKTPFVAWIYGATAPLVAPFARIRSDWKWPDGFVIDFPTLAALIVYAIVGHLLLTILSPKQSEV